MNWKIRFKNKNVWIAIIPAVILLIQAVGKLFGFEIDLSEIGNNLISIVNALFVVLAIIGIITDPTTSGIGDSERALNYTELKK